MAHPGCGNGRDGALAFKNPQYIGDGEQIARQVLLRWEGTGPVEAAQGGLPGGSWTERWIGEGQGNRVKKGRVSGRRRARAKTCS